MSRRRNGGWQGRGSAQGHQLAASRKAGFAGKFKSAICHNCQRHHIRVFRPNDPEGLVCGQCYRELNKTDEDKHETPQLPEDMEHRTPEPR